MSCKTENKKRYERLAQEKLFHIATFGTYMLLGELVCKMVFWWTR